MFSRGHFLCHDLPVNNTKIPWSLLLLGRVIKLTNAFNVTVRLFSNRPQRSIRVAVPSTPHGEREVSRGGGGRGTAAGWPRKTLQYGKNEKASQEALPSKSVMFLPHFDVFCDLLLII